MNINANMKSRCSIWCETTHQALVLWPYQWPIIWNHNQHIIMSSQITPYWITLLEHHLHLKETKSRIPSFPLRLNVLSTELEGLDSGSLQKKWVQGIFTTHTETHARARAALPQAITLVQPISKTESRARCTTDTFLNLNIRMHI